MADKPYEMPDPRKRPDSFLTCLYKTLKCIEYDNRAWDKLYFARCNKRTAQLLDILGDDVLAAARCLQDLKQQFEAEGTKWTIETVVAYSFEWKAAQQKRTDRDCLRRFIGDVTERLRVGPLQRADVSGLLSRITALPEAAGVSELAAARGDES